MNYREAWYEGEVEAKTLLDEIERLQAALGEACEQFERDALRLHYSAHGRALADKARRWRGLLCQRPNAAFSGRSQEK